MKRLACAHRRASVLSLVVLAVLLSVVFSLGTPLAGELSPTMHAALQTDRQAVRSPAEEEPAITGKAGSPSMTEALPRIPSRFLDSRGFPWMLSQLDDTRSE